MASDRDMGIAMSGGGHRATVFGLGSLLALVDLGMNGRAASISSVSGGSIANGIVMTGPEYGTIDAPTFEDRLGPALQSIATRGILLESAPATAGYIRSLVVAGVAGVVGLIGVLVFAIVQLWIGMAVSAVVAVVGLIAAWRLFRRRSVHVERAIDSELLGDEMSPLVSAERSGAGVHHVICTTELQTGESVYFTNRAVYAYRYGSSTGDIDLPLAIAVQASACVPGAFAPRVLALSSLGKGLHAPTDSEGVQNDEIASIVVVDGGVYDNMADQWEYDYANRLANWPGLAQIQPDRGSFIVVVNASGGWNDPIPIGRGGVAQEVAGLTRSKSVQYDVSTSHRRQALYDRFNKAGAGEGDEMNGVFVQITHSPYRAATFFDDEQRPASNPEAAARAAEALEFLGRQGYDEETWRQIVGRTSGVKTTLAKLGVEPTVELLEHGYVLTMVNLYVFGGRGSLVDIDRDRLRRLCGGASGVHSTR